MARTPHFGGPGGSSPAFSESSTRGHAVQLTLSSLYAQRVDAMSRAFCDPHVDPTSFLHPDEGP